MVVEQARVESRVELMQKAQAGMAERAARAMWAIHEAPQQQHQVLFDGEALIVRHLCETHREAGNVGANTESKRLTFDSQSGPHRVRLRLIPPAAS